MLLRYNKGDMRYPRGAVKLVLAGCIVALPIIGLWQRQNIYDWVRLRGYSPSSQVSTLASSSSMNDKARRLFYVNHPELISDSSTFRSDCTVTEQTIILGCYHPNQRGIFVYDVKDQRLDGVEEVTSAHEMLHAAYDRLSGDDKNKINKMLEDFYKNDLKDKRLLDIIEAYKQSEPDDLVNEMHSIFGTEVVNLPAPLEDYYKRYFNNRASVVGFSQKYEAEFTNRSAKTAQYEKQLNVLKAKISTEETEFSGQSAKINAEQVHLDSLRSSGRIEEYNAGVAAYNADVDAYNAGVAWYKGDINSYNALVEQYNAVAGELKQLYGALDTRLAPKAQ